MSNYLFDLIAKSFNLIDTVQPFVLSVFEPLPESTLDWEPSIFNAEEIELETTSQPDNFTFDISPTTNLQISEDLTNLLLTNLTPIPVQSSQQLPKSTPDFAQKPDLESSFNSSFSESDVKRERGTLNREQGTWDVDLNPNPNLQFIEDGVLEPQMGTDKLLLTSNTSNPIFKQRQLTPTFLPQQSIEINSLSLSLQSPLTSDLQIYSTENQTESGMFSFANQEKTFLQPNLNTTILTTAIAKENNAPISKLIDEKSAELTTQLLNNQSVENSRAVSLHPLPKVSYLKQSLPQIQAETSTILSIPSLLQQEKSATENLHKQPTEINPVFTHSQLSQVESSEAFPPQLQSKPTAMSTTGFSTRRWANANAPATTQVLPLKPALAVETNTPASTTIQPQEQPIAELLSTPALQTENILTLQILSSQIIEQPTAMSTAGFSTRRYTNAYAPAISQELPLKPIIPVETNTTASTAIQPQEQPVTESPQKRTLQTANISTSQILSSQIIQQPKAIAPTTAQVLPLIPAL
ncbi:hypothetical protein, partial [Nostoc sp. CHAB 5715]|uniref:hypothetical protein n=1 Tax=Nostoc sp. CHAB 5715 TaxID=2780400 RepID=UPI001E347407